MASSISVFFYLIFLTLISTTPDFSSSLSLKLRQTEDLDRPISSTSATDVHELLPKYGLPKGLLPDNVKGYTLSNDGSFEIELESTCYVKFDRLVYYKKNIKGKISYGKVSDVSGIQAKKAFFWVSISEIVAHPDKGTIEFKVGFLSEELSYDLFEVVHSCKSNTACATTSTSTEPVQSI